MFITGWSTFEGESRKGKSEGRGRGFIDSLYSR